MMEGGLVLDKPSGITSHDAVVAVRRLLSERRIGHLGTLDPFASGVLVLLLGRATRLARFYEHRDKSYTGTIRFGFATSTYDVEGAATSADCSPVLDESELRAVFGEFLGKRLQEPPPYSAKKISGVPAYRLARKGRAVALEAAPVVIHELDLAAVEGPCVRFRTRVSAGTYIRSLAHELGQRLGVGAHLTQLRRTAVGEFGEASAISLASLEQAIREGVPPVIPSQCLLADCPEVLLQSSQTVQALQGRDIEVNCVGDRVKLLDQENRLIAVAERVGESLFHPIVVLGAPDQLFRGNPGSGP
jgi:tRNA pseudouridine55 synthase